MAELQAQIRSSKETIAKSEKLLARLDALLANLEGLSGVRASLGHFRVPHPRRAQADTPDGAGTPYREVCIELPTNLIEGDAEIQAGLRSIQALKFLRPTPEADLGCVEVALGIDADVVHPFELPGHASAAAPRGEHLAVLPPERDDLIIRPIGDEDEPLHWIFRQHQVPHRAVGERLRLDPELLHERAVLAEHLDAVVGAVADVDEAVVAQPHTVHRVGKLLGERRLGIIGLLLVVARAMAVGAPVPLVGAGPAVEHEDAPVEIAVGDIELVRRFVDLQMRWPAELGLAVRATGRSSLADLLQEFAVRRELQDLMIARIVTGEPDVALLVDENAVLHLGPVIAVGRPAPRAQQVAVRVELEHRCSRGATFGR